MAHKAGSKPTGLVNNAKVRCSQCGATLYVNPTAQNQAADGRAPTATRSTDGAGWLVGLTTDREAFSPDS
jgi:hypothetical protein